MNASTTRDADVRRISCCLDAVEELVRRSDPRQVSVTYAQNGDPTTTLDREINRLIFENLPEAGEGWLSEESQDNPERLCLSRVWVVDPIDGTREFVEGIPEWCVSIALVEDNEAVAGGVLNPLTGEKFLGSIETGLEIAAPLSTRRRQKTSANSCVLVSRREYREGKWKTLEEPDIAVSPIGSIAYRLALVAAGYADATCTLEPRNEWDVAGGIALILSSGGRAQMRDGSPIRFNQKVPLVRTTFAFGRACPPSLPRIWDMQLK